MAVTSEVQLGPMHFGGNDPSHVRSESMRVFSFRI
jgi:hypothetical protein